MKSVVMINHSYSEDDHAEYDIEDSCDEDDNENMKLSQWLRRYSSPVCI